MNRRKLSHRRWGPESLEPRQLLAADELVFFEYVDDSGQLQGGHVYLPEAAPPADDSPSAPPDASQPLSASAEGDALLDSETVVDNGPTSNRIDLVIVGDGYTEDELPNYAAHVNALLPTFFAEAPFDAYATYFNVHRVDVISVDSGVDHDPNQGVLRNTALDMEYWCAGTERLLCINQSKANAAARSAPQVDQVLAIANSTKYGGAGYDNLATLAGDNGAAVELALHEFGHSFADLADEYDTGGPTVYAGGEPDEGNVSKLDAAELAAQEFKWHLWLDHPDVDAFEGARYSKQGIYRPTANSKMRSLGQPYGPVNTELLIFEIYKAVGPIDSATPAGSYDDTIVLEVEPLQPTSHELDVAWWLGEEPIAGATDAALDVASLGLEEGSHEIRAVVTDPTPWVRDEEARSSLMTEQREWTIVVPPPAAVGPRVDASSVLEGDIVDPGPLSVTIHFNAALDEAVLDAGDVSLVGAATGAIAPTSFQYDPDEQALTLDFEDLLEDDYTLTLVSGADAFRDLAGDELDGEPDPATTVPSGDGSPGGDFVVNFQALQQDPFFSPDSIRWFPGGTIALPVLLEDLTDVRSVDFTMTYDTSVVDVAADGVRLAELTSGWAMEFNVDDAAGRIVVSMFDTGPQAGGGGPVAYVDLLLAEDAPLGFYSFEVDSVQVNEGRIPIRQGNGELEIVPATPHVQGVQVGAGIVEIDLSFAPDLATLNLYDGQDAEQDAPDVTLTGPAGSPVSGSLVWEAESERLVFVKRGGPFEAGQYTLTLASRPDGFATPAGELLDGDLDLNVGGDFIHVFEIQQNSDPVISLPDFARGPRQAVLLPNTEAGGGIPVQIDDAAGLERFSLELNFDAALLNVSGVRLPDDLEAAGWQIEDSNLDGPGRVSVTASGPAPLDAGARDLLLLDADVPDDDALRGSAHVLRLTNVMLNEGALPAVADEALAALAYLGDATGNGGYSGLDASFTARVAVGLDQGLDAYPLLDPILLVDATGNGGLSGLDASFIARKAVGLPQPEIPDIPPANPAPAPSANQPSPESVVTATASGAMLRWQPSDLLTDASDQEDLDQQRGTPRRHGLILSAVVEEPTFSFSFDDPRSFVFGSGDWGRDFGSAMTDDATGEPLEDELCDIWPAILANR